MSGDRERMAEMISALKQQRDELQLRMHLAGAEAKEEWSRLNDQLTELTDRYEPLKSAVGETAEGVWESVKLVGDEIKQGFERIRSNL